MNIQETIQALTLQKKVTKSDCVLISKKNLLATIQASAEEAAELSSRVFCLIDVPINRLACPSIASQKDKVQSIVASGSLKPIVADLNAKKVGSIAYTPKVVVIVGKESFDAATILGKTSIRIWASKQAAAILGCSCGDDVKAGGPGSGPRQGTLGAKEWDEPLNKHGYTHRKTTGSKAIFKHSSGNTLEVSDEGDWKHFTYKNGQTKKGSDAKSLATHLDSVHK